MLKNTILDNWYTDITGSAQIISDLENTEFPAWTVKFPDAYGVAIPYNGDKEINENFANAKILSTSIMLPDGEAKGVLALISYSEDIKVPFAALCEALIEPGEGGEQRIRIAASPISWWQEWKELLGNRSVDERVYDTLGELCGVLYSVRQGEDPIWNGPQSSSYDIETETRFIEMKSTITRDKREVTISSQFQLFPPGKPLELILCVFEPVVTSGISIDEILDKFNEIGYNTNNINDKLESKGLEKGMTARKKKFILHEMLLYEIDDSFPRITPQSFVGGVMPEGITKVTYTVDLSGLTPVSLLQGETNDI